MFRKKGRFSLLENFQKNSTEQTPSWTNVNPPPSWIPTFMLSTNKNFILSCSHCYCIILTSYSLYTEVMLIFILMLNIYRMLFLVMKRIQIVKIPPPLVPTARKKNSLQQNFQCPPPSPPSYWFLEITELVCKCNFSRGALNFVKWNE